MIAPSIWIDPKSGNDYFLTAQYSEDQINSLDTLRNIPVRSSDGNHSRADAMLLRNVATITREQHPAEADHYNIQRVVDVLVAPGTDDMGGALKAVRKALADLKLPSDVGIAFRGSVDSMERSFSSFGYGLLMAVMLLYLVMVAQFRSFLDPFIIMFSVPMGMVGVTWTLLLTGTTLNIESFMGIIAMVGIVVSNAILLVDFANQRYRAGEDLRRAIIESAQIRMRPILMTTLATVVGLMPMALKLGAGSEASAPLARSRRRRPRGLNRPHLVPGTRSIRDLLRPPLKGVEMKRSLIFVAVVWVSMVATGCSRASGDTQPIRGQPSLCLGRYAATWSARSHYPVT